MITLIGVGHVFNIRPNIEKLIYDRNPNVVCVELDKFRYQALINKQRNEDAPLMYQLLSRFQKKMADQYGVDVGEEMLGAVDVAKRIDAKVAFIDADASFIFNRFWNSMSFSEKIKFIVGAFGGIFVRKKQVERELERFGNDSEKYLEMFGKEFPTVKEELIDKRDYHMAKAIREINQSHNNIVAVIGDGHITGVSKALADLDLEIIRLKDVRNMKLMDSKPKTDTTSKVTFSYVYSDKAESKNNKKKGS
jgi:pheromone shutdown protein TraB